MRFITSLGLLSILAFSLTACDRSPSAEDMARDWAKYGRDGLDTTSVAFAAQFTEWAKTTPLSEVERYELIIDEVQWLSEGSSVEVADALKGEVLPESAAIFEEFLRPLMPTQADVEEAEREAARADRRSTCRVHFSKEDHRRYRSGLNKRAHPRWVEGLDACEAEFPELYE